MAGAATLLLVGVCVAAAWPAESPLVPREGGRHDGDARWAWLFLAAGAGAVAAYAAGIALCARRGARLGAVAATAVAIQLAPLAAPLLLSSDAWTYWAYGRIGAAHGANPYADPPRAFPDDPAYPWVGAAWRDTTSVYGPAFTLTSEAVAAAAGESRHAAAWAYKLLAALAVLVALAFAARVSPRPALAAVVVGWNPLLALHLAGGGHNDAWVAALLVAAGRRRAGGALWALAILVKWIPLVLLPLHLVAERARGRRFGYGGLVFAGALVGGLATWRYGVDWVTAAGPLAAGAETGTRFALPERLAQLGVPRTLAVVALALAFAAAYAWLLREAVRGRARLGLAAALLLLALPYLTPWYLAWAVPLAAADDDADARWLCVALTAYLLPQAVPL